MIDDIASVSPLAGFVGSFISSPIPGWVLISTAIALHWLFLILPTVVTIGYLDRKLGADIQMRLGPNRVSIYGLFQSVADVLKSIFKEDDGPRKQESLLYYWGVVGAIVCVFIAIGCIPMAESWSLSNLDSGVLCVLASLLFANFCVFLAAYSTESGWSVLSAFRVLAMVSAYLVPVSVAMAPPVLISGATSLNTIAMAQGGWPWNWNLFHNPGTLLSGMALYIGLMMWQGRSPFDQHRASAEVGGGYVSEYSGARRGLAEFLEYLCFFLASALIVTAYLGGWRTPFDLSSFGRAANLVQWLFFTVKLMTLVLLSIWIRWSLPRLRIDQVINLSWRVLVPMGLIGTGVSLVWLVLFHGRGVGDFL